ncbi:MAG: DUF2793 domain-containing protein [Gammaproteobacteria bacterium]|nr:MAG: DUF2793 domain-containing protein [Gammaproteobacteria bacterium]
MPDPLFDVRTPRLDLPLLFAAQAQKEGYVNEIAARIDALMHGAIEAELASPPASPADGQCWLVASDATGEWAGQTGAIAARQAGNWLFFAPRDGMRLLNRATGQDIRYLAGWKNPVRPAAPGGGSVVDSALRAAFAALCTALVDAGILRS